MNDTVEFPATVYIPLSAKALEIYAKLLPTQTNLSDFWIETEVEGKFYDINIWTTDRVRYITAYPIAVVDNIHVTDTFHWQTLFKVHLPKWMKHG